MMHRCSSSQGNMAGPCSCGLFHSQSNSFSMLFSMPNHESFDETDMYPYASSSSSLVDCTLSLGTPSTRLCEEYDVIEDKRSGSRHDHRRSGGNSWMSNSCWDMLQNKNSHQTPKSSRGSNGNSYNNSSGNDSLLARRCANCDTTSTPLWRNGPRGPKSLCNACGIRFKKEERRATAANANNNSSGAMLDYQQQYGYGQYHHNNNSWVEHHSQSSQSQKTPCLSPVNEFRFIEDSDHDSDNGIPFLSWRLNVTDRPTNLVNDFTR